MAMNIKVWAMTKLTIYGKGQRQFMKVSKMPRVLKVPKVKGVVRPSSAAQCMT